MNTKLYLGLAASFGVGAILGYRGALYKLERYIESEEFREEVRSRITEAMDEARDKVYKERRYATYATRWERSLKDEY